MRDYVRSGSAEAVEALPSTDTMLEPMPLWQGVAAKRLGLGSGPGFGVMAGMSTSMKFIIESYTYIYIYVYT